VGLLVFITRHRYEVKMFKLLILLKMFLSLTVLYEVLYRDRRGGFYPFVKVPVQSLRTVTVDERDHLLFEQ
jgi:hypothetical protein